MARLQSSFLLLLAGLFSASACNPGSVAPDEPDPEPIIVFGHVAVGATPTPDASVAFGRSVAIFTPNPRWEIIGVATTDANGRYRIETEPTTECSGQVRATIWGIEHWGGSVRGCGMNTVNFDVPIALIAVTGTVRVDGVPVPGVPIRLGYDEIVLDSARTTDDGSYEVSATHLGSLCLGLGFQYPDVRTWISVTLPDLGVGPRDSGALQCGSNVRDFGFVTGA